MLPGPKYTVIIPAHNEAQRIRNVLSAYAAEFDDSEIIVVLNGCVDETSKCVAEIERLHKNIRRVEIEYAVGKGGAVRTGFLAASAPIVGYVDADGATSAKELRRLFAELADGDAVIGSRWMAGANVVARQPFTRRVASRIFNLCIRLLFRLPFKDTQCGAKVFRATALERSLPGVETSNLAFDVDLLYHLVEGGFSVREVPTEWHDRAGSRVDVISAGPKMLTAILRLRLRYSLFRTFIPWFDRLFPTQPLRTHDRFRILVLCRRDVLDPAAGDSARYLFEVGKRWVAEGHDVEWISTSFDSSQRTEVLEGVKFTRVGATAGGAFTVPLEYLRRFRDRFDVILDVQDGLPFFSPLFSLKPKVRLEFGSQLRRVPVFTRLNRLASFISAKLLPIVYESVPYVLIDGPGEAGSPEVRHSGGASTQIKSASRGASWDAAADALLDMLLRQGSVLPFNLVRRGSVWHLVQRNTAPHAVNELRELQGAGRGSDAGISAFSSAAIE